MKRIIQGIEFIFGRVHREKKQFVIFYWTGVVFYVLFILLAFAGRMFPEALFPLIVFPLLFRFVYGINIKLQASMAKRRGTPLIIMAALFIAVVIGIQLIGSAGLNVEESNRSVSTFTRKSEVNGKLSLRIGSLKGSYEIKEFEAAEDGKIRIPYEASVESGSVTLMVTKSGEDIWQKEIAPASSGVIEIDGTLGRHTVGLRTVEAKKIEVKLSLD